MDYALLVLAYLLSIVSGHELIRPWVIYLKRSIDPGYNATAHRNVRLDLSIGVFERGVVTTLVIWAPGLLAPFIGGWTALKFAANWEGRSPGPPGTDLEAMARHRLVGLLGSAGSMSIAVVAGLLVHPDALAAWK